MRSLIEDNRPVRPSRADTYIREHQRVVTRSFAKLQTPLLSLASVLVDALKTNHKFVLFGNGGSAAEASHFAGELLGRFSRSPRPSFPAVALSNDPAVVTCIGNDFGFASLFERQVDALVQPGDVAFGFTTSGKSENVLRGLIMARKKGAITVALTGSAGLTKGRAQYLFDVPSAATSHIQEVHLLFIHLWCGYIDDAFIDKHR